MPRVLSHNGGEPPQAGGSPHGSLSPGGIRLPAADASGVLLGAAAQEEGWGEDLEANGEWGRSGGRGDTGDQMQEREITKTQLELERGRGEH